MGLFDVAASTPQGRFFPARVSLLAGCAWATTVTLVQIAATTLSLTPFSSPLTGWMLLPWVLTLAVLVACAAVGALVGSRTSSAGAAPISALLVFAWLYGSLRLEGRWSVLAALDNATFYTPTTEPSPQIIVLHIGLSVAVVLASYAALAVTKSKGVIAAAVAVLCLSLVAVGLATVSPERSRFRTFRGAPVCATQSHVQLCVWPAMADQLPDQLPALVAAHQLAAPSWKVARRCAQVGIPASKLPPGETPIPVSLPNEPIEPAAEIYVYSAVQAVRPRCAGSPSAADEAWTNLGSWLSARLGYGWATDSEPVRITAEPKTVQRAWVRQQLAAGTCT